MGAALGAGTVVVPAPGARGAELHVTVDPAEHQRRQDAGCGPIVHLGALGQLLALPAGIPVNLASLPDRELRALGSIPRGAATVAGGYVTRHAVRPAVVRLAVVRSATACESALDRAGAFAPFCARTVVVKRRPALPETLIEFDFWGVGIVWDHDGEWETLVEARPWRLGRHTAAGWRFVEQAYAAVLDERAGRLAPRG